MLKLFYFLLQNIFKIALKELIILENLLIFPFLALIFAGLWSPVY